VLDDPDRQVRPFGVQLLGQLDQRVVQLAARVDSPTR
jgi:hypothetical protein